VFFCLARETCIARGISLEEKKVSITGVQEKIGGKIRGKRKKVDDFSNKINFQNK
jgi:hypothetical protein